MANVDEEGGVSVSPFGFLTLLRSVSFAAVPNRRVDGIISDDGGGVMAQRWLRTPSSLPLHPPLLPRRH